MSRVIGLDYSMSCPCATVLSNDNTFEKSSSFFLTDKKKLAKSFGNVCGELHKSWRQNEERYENIAMQIFSLVSLSLDDIVVIEDYSLGSKGKTFNIAENAGIMKYLLYKKGVKFVVIPPSVIKKSFTGKGNADKNLMYKSFLAKESVDLYTQLALNATFTVASPISDIVDSFALALWYRNEKNSSFV